MSNSIFVKKPLKYLKSFPDFYRVDEDNAFADGTEWCRRCTFSDPMADAYQYAWYAVGKPKNTPRCDVDYEESMPIGHSVSTTTVVTYKGIEIDRFSDDYGRRPVLVPDDELIKRVGQAPTLALAKKELTRQYARLNRLAGKAHYEKKKKELKDNGLNEKEVEAWFAIKTEWKYEEVEYKIELIKFLRPNTLREETWLQDLAAAAVSVLDATESHKSVRAFCQRWQLKAVGTTHPRKVAYLSFAIKVANHAATQ